jgi:exopolysaccharide production protein ExoZ
LTGPVRYLPNIQALRFVAAMMVLYAHLLNETVGHGLPLNQPAQDHTGIAWRTGVDAFFIVSGFIMYYLSHDKFGSARNAMTFLKRRFLRVAPLYWLFTALMLVALAVVHDHIIHNDIDLAIAVKSLLFIPTVRADGDTYPILAVGWTLNYEIFFYLMFAAAMLARRWVGLMGLFIVLFGLSLLGHAVGKSMTLARFYSDPIIVEFLLGIGLAQLYLMGARVPVLVQWALVAAGFALMAVMGHYQSLDRWIWGGLPALVVAAGLALGPEIRGRWLALGGDASYSLYLSHPFVLSALTLVWTKAKFATDGWLYVPVGLAVCTAAAVAVYRFIETPMLAWLKRRFDRVASGAGAAPAAAP